MEDIYNLINETEEVYYADLDRCSEFDPKIHKKYNAKYYFKVRRLELEAVHLTEDFAYTN